MNCQAQAAFEASDVVLEEVWVFVKVDSLERELPKALAPVSIGCRL